MVAARVVPIAARLHLLKKWLASAGVSLELQIAIEKGMVEAAHRPLSAVVKDSITDISEQGMRRTSYQRLTFSTKNLLEEIAKLPNLKKLFLTPGLEMQFSKNYAIWLQKAGEEATALATKGWVKACQGYSPPACLFQLDYQDITLKIKQSY